MVALLLVVALAVKEHIEDEGVLRYKRFGGLNDIVFSSQRGGLPISLVSRMKISLLRLTGETLAQHSRAKIAKDSDQHWKACVHNQLEIYPTARRTYQKRI